MLGLDIEKLMHPFIEAQKDFDAKLGRVIELLEEISKKLDK